ncbi:unnamed protein product [Blepharisma stoltei]|uniref:Uncharacterized protein n=1 Tax=Blepharisma stoltei TaxID=1481888 RepID=A0AAU9IWB4_9CILI|nr:unnamed protein product [Blepharisma stoltei]
MAFPKTSVATSHEGAILDTKFDYYGRRFATCGSDGKISVFLIEDNNAHKISEINYHQATVTSLSWSHPQFGNLLASGSGDRKVAIWKEAAQNKWTLIYEYEEHQAPITSLDWAPYEFGLVLLAGSADGCISLITWLLDDRWESTKLMAHEGGVSSVFWLPSVSQSILDTIEMQKRFVTGGADGIVKVWKWDEENLHFDELLKHSGCVRDVAALPYKPFYGYRIISAGEDGNVILWTSSNESWDSEIIFSIKVPVLKISWNEGNLLGISSADLITRIAHENENGQWEIAAEANESGEFQVGHIN